MTKRLPHSLLRLQRTRLGFAKPGSSTRRISFATPVNAQDFSDLVSRVQEKAKELREAAISRQPFQWPRTRPQLPTPSLDTILGRNPYTSIPDAIRADSLGFGFSAGGMLFPYYIGVLEGLQGLGLATDKTHMAGASAGSIIAVCHHSGIPTDVVAAACLELAQDCRQNGIRGRLGSVLERFLRDLLPEDIHERCHDRTFIAVTKAFPRPRGELISRWTSKEDLIQTTLTSCHLPWWFDNTLTTQFRGAQYYDGGLTNFIPLPPTVKAGVQVCCFPAKQMSSVTNIQISPDNFEEWPYSMGEMLGWALNPADDETLVQFISKGRADAEAWALASGAADALKAAEAARAGLESEDYPALKGS